MPSSSEKTEEQAKTSAITYLKTWGGMHVCTLFVKSSILILLLRIACPSNSSSNANNRTTWSSSTICTAPLSPRFTLQFLLEFIRLQNRQCWPQCSLVWAIFVIGAEEEAAVRQQMGTQGHRQGSHARCLRGEYSKWGHGVCFGAKRTGRAG